MASEDEWRSEDEDSELERAIAEMRAGTVTEVDLNYNSIGAAGATQLADALRTNTSVEQLLVCRSEEHTSELQSQG